MTGIQPQTSVVWSNPYANWATTTAHFLIINLEFCFLVQLYYWGLDPMSTMFGYKATTSFYFSISNSESTISQPKRLVAHCPAITRFEPTMLRLRGWLTNLCAKTTFQKNTILIQFLQRHWRSKLYHNHFSLILQIVNYWKDYLRLNCDCGQWNCHLGILLTPNQVPLDVGTSIKKALQNVTKMNRK